MTTESLNRITAYLDAKKEVSGLHPEVIHVIHANGGKHELKVSDLEALLQRGEICLPNENVPHHNAAFINAIWEEGTKEESCRYLQQTWNELCELKQQLKPVSVSLEKCGDAILLMSETGRSSEWRDKEVNNIAKAVLDAAGVPYHEG